MSCSVMFWLALLQPLILALSGIGEASSAETCDGSDETCTAAPGSFTSSQERLARILERVPCNVERIDAHEIDAKKFEVRYRKGKQPLIVRNWTGQWPAHNSWQDGGFVSRLSDLELSLKYQVVPDSDAEIDRLAVGKYLSSPSEHLLFATGDWTLASRAGSDILPLPEALETMYDMPVYTIGRNGTGSTVHAHEEAWISQVVGTKVWILAPEFLESGAALDMSELGADGEIDQVEPCELLHGMAEDRASFHKALMACAVGPGETVYIPEHMHHGTCNFGDVTVGVGARGDSSKRSKLFNYAGRCQLDQFKAHVERYGDLDAIAPGLMGMSVLQFACYVGCENIVEYLIGGKEGEERVDVQAKYKTELLDKPIDAVSVAAMQGQFEVLDVFARRYGHKYISKKSVIAKLIQGDVKSQPEIAAKIQSLLEGRVELPSKTVLENAFEAGHGAVVKVLAGYLSQEDLVAVGPDGTSPLHQAVREGRTSVVVGLLDAGAPADDIPETQTGDNHKSVHLAAGMGHRKILEILIKRRANPEAQSASGNTPLDIAKMEEHADVIEFLQSIQ